MVEKVIIGLFTLIIISLAAYLLNQAGFGQTFLESALFVILGIILLIFTVSTLSHPSP